MNLKCFGSNPSECGAHGRVDEKAARLVVIRARIVECINERNRILSNPNQYADTALALATVEAIIGNWEKTAEHLENSFYETIEGFQELQKRIQQADKEERKSLKDRMRKVKRQSTQVCWSYTYRPEVFV